MQLALEFFYFFFKVFLGCKKAVDLFENSGRFGLKHVGKAGENLLLLLYHAACRSAGHCLDTPDPRGYGAFAGDFEHADFARGMDMGASAQLHAVVRNTDHPDRIAVLFTKKRDSSHLNCLLLGQHPHGHLPVLANVFIDRCFNLFQIVFFNRFKMRKVKTQPFRSDQRARLLDMAAQMLAQGGLQNMGGGVVVCRCLSLSAGNPQNSLITFGNLTRDHPAPMHNKFRQRLERINDFNTKTLSCNTATIADLAAGLSVKRGFGRDDLNIFPCCRGLAELAVAQHANNTGRAFLPVIAGKDNAHAFLQNFFINALYLFLARALPCLPRPRLLLPHGPVKAGLVNLHVLLPGNIGGQVKRKPVRVIQLKGGRSRNNVLLPGLEPCHLVLKYLQP